MTTAARPLRRVALVAAIGLALAACAAPDATDPDPTPDAVGTPTPTPEAVGTPTPTGPPDATPEAADPLFHGEEPTVDGGTLDLATLAGRDVAAWFWAPW